MNDTTYLKAKVLLLDQDPEQCRQLTEFCDEAGLLPVQPLRTATYLRLSLELHILQPRCLEPSRSRPPGSTAAHFSSGLVFSALWYLQHPPRTLALSCRLSDGR